MSRKDPRGPSLGSIWRRIFRTTVALSRRFGVGAAMPGAHAVHFLIGIAALAAAFVALLIVEAAVSPWARSLTFGATFTGEWIGEMTTRTGVRRSVWIDIEHAQPAAACVECPGIEGSATTCDPNGRAQNYELWGDVDNWSGARFHLKAREKEESEVRLLYLEGVWRGDEIRLTTTLVAPGFPQTTRVERNERGEPTIVAVDGHPDTRAPISFSLHRGARRDFAAQCRAAAS